LDLSEIGGYLFAIVGVVYPRNYRRSFTVKDVGGRTFYRFPMPQMCYNEAQQLERQSGAGHTLWHDAQEASPMRSPHSTPNSVRVENGVVYLALTNSGREVIAEAMIDEDDLPRVLAVGRWFANWHRLGQCYYVKAKKGRILLHRFVMDAPAGYVVDHINHNTLDCRKANLRVCTHSENMQNRQRAHRHSRSGVRGVQQVGGEQRWRVRIRVNNQLHHIGTFTTLEDAEAAAIMARLRLMTHTTN
jgi:hypothetical protein